MKQAIKICGITCKEDVRLLNEFSIDYAGFVLFYERSRRYVKPESAAELMKGLRPKIKRVAVCVSPDLEQLQIIKDMGFELVQIHGPVSGEVLEQSPLPVFRAVSPEEAPAAGALPEIVKGLVFDGKIPGGGKTFDWSLLSGLNRGSRLLMLAGGLEASNVRAGIAAVEPDIVDVSSGVEKDGERGKDRRKIEAFVQAVRED